MDLDDAETMDVVFASQAEAEGEHTIDSETASPVCNPTHLPHIYSPQDDNQIADLDDTDTGDIVFTLRDEFNSESETVVFTCPSTSNPHLTPLQDDSRIMDLDGTETRDVEGEPNTGSETASFICNSTSAPTPHITSLWDDSRPADLDDTEVDDVASVEQADVEVGHSTDSEAASLIYRPIPAPHLTPSQDDSQIMDLDDMDTGDVVFASQADAGGEYNTESETVISICRSAFVHSSRLSSG